MKQIILVIAVLFSVQLAAQTGTIRGTVMDDETGETIVGANATIEVITVGTSTDLDGKYSFKAPVGTYDVKISYITMQEVIIPNVVVKEGEVTLLETVRLKSKSVMLAGVDIVAEARQRSEQALNKMKQKSIAMKDGVTAEKLALTGDGNAAEAAKRVTGVSIEGGKYIYVRGLGDRYSKVTLNQVDIPGLDPDKNSLQMDIFPTNLIENIVVSKNFTADMPADFAGGVLNVETKSFPDEKEMSVSAGISYNPSMHFNSDYLAYEGSSTDFLGFDNGKRQNPDRDGLNIPTPFNGASRDQVNSFVSDFDRTLAASKQSSLLDYNFGYSFGNQLDLENKNKLGYVFSLSYKTDYTYYDDVEFGEYQRSEDSSNYEMVNANTQTGAIGEKSVLLSSMAGLAYKTQYSKYRLSVLRLQNGTSKAGKFNLENNPLGVGQSGYSATSDVLEYNERALTNVLLNGNHLLDTTGWEIDWRLSSSFSNSDDPDIRKTVFTRKNGGFVFSPGDGGLPTRIWRSLTEYNGTAKADAIKEYKLNDKDGRFLFGFNYTYKQRDYEILGYDMQLRSTLSQSWDGNDADQVLTASNLYPNLPNGVYYQSANNDPNSNAYESSIRNFAFYVSNEFTLSSALKGVIGLRVEDYVQRHTGRDQTFSTTNGQSGRSLEDEVVLESTDFFPSLNLIYNVKEDQNLRFSYARTIARPSFKELSFAQILDPLTGRTFNGSFFEYNETDNQGNITKVIWDGNLVPTNIDNIDFRWEKFMERGQIVSGSIFYKKFKNPIELVRIPVSQTTTEFQPRNVGDGQVYGVELEATHGLSFISDKLENYSFSGNVTLVKSQVDMTDVEFEARKEFEKEGQTVENTRDMAGQAPYVLNLGFSYKNVETGLSAGLFYNVKGSTLVIVGTGLSPDVYQIPFHSLNFSINKKLGEDQKTVIDLKVSNILADEKELVYQSYEAEDQVFSRFNPGTAISIGISHKF